MKRGSDIFNKALLVIGCVAILTACGRSSITEEGDPGGNNGISEPEPVLGAALVTWSTPDTREDGSQLANTELAGFKIKYGTTQSILENEIIISDSSITSHNITDLVPGTHYFVVTAYDTDGVESEASNMASKTIQ